MIFGISRYVTKALKACYIQIIIDQCNKYSLPSRNVTFNDIFFEHK